MWVDRFDRQQIKRFIKIVTFSTTLALLLLLLLIPVIWLGRPSRGTDRRRESISLTIRLILLIILILSLAGIQVRRHNDDLAVVFLLDVSDSMSSDSKAFTLDFINQALQAMTPDDEAAIITFASNALVDRSLSGSKYLESIRSVPITNQTDLAEAIRLAMALFPSDAARRMVILSDGRATIGDAQTAADYAASSGIEIVALPVVTPLENEVLISNAQVPNHLVQNERFTLNTTIQASQSGSAIIRIFESGKLIHQDEYTLNRGTQIVSIPLLAGAPGFTSFLIQLEATNDTLYQNNEFYTYSQIKGSPTILLIAPEEGEIIGPGNQTRQDEFSHLLRVFEAAGLVVETAQPSGLPQEISLLANYQAIVLVDLPARQLSNQQMLALQTYVRDLGGGLLVVGGPTSFGVGGYYQTPLEEALPVEMQIKDEQRRPSLAIVFVIDHSGSMSETSGGVTKVDLAKEAAIRSIELLGPMDRIGVVAFDDNASWVVEMTDLADRQSVVNAIGSIRSGGGTDILAGLRAMANVLPDDASSVKHVILLTDGGADPTGIPELVQSLYSEHGITLSTVGIGRDAAPYLPELAELGGGRFHFTADPATIPSIFTEETTLATRAYLIEETFFPQLANDSPIMSGIHEIPQLYGYVGTSIKDHAITILLSDQGDPILASWQYGLGRSVAFTSDATGRWAKEWISWDAFPIFWSQVLSYVLAQPSPSSLEINIDQVGEEAQISIDARQQIPAGISSDHSNFLNGYTIQANIITPDTTTQTISLHQIASGHYTAKFIPDQQGVYLIHINGEAPQTGNNAATKESLSTTAGWVQSYSPEYQWLESNPDALYRIAVNNGGRIASQNPAEVFAHTLSSPPVILPVWQGLLYIALLLLPIDIAVRRLIITQGDLIQFLKRIQLNHTKLQETATAHNRSTQVEGLFRAKERTIRLRDDMRQSKEGASTQQSRPGVADSYKSINGMQAKNELVEATSKTDKTGESQTTAALLLARKRSRRGHNEQKTNKTE